MESMEESWDGSSGQEMMKPLKVPAGEEGQQFPSIDDHTDDPHTQPTLTPSHDQDAPDPTMSSRQESPRTLEVEKMGEELEEKADHSSKPKSKIDLNTNLSPDNPPDIYIPEGRNTKNDLNFRTEEDAGREIPMDESTIQRPSSKSLLNQSGVEGSESLKPEIMSSAVDELVTVPVLSTQKNPCLVQKCEVPPKTHSDGKNALNYGPKTALESMMADLQRNSESLPPDNDVSQGVVTAGSLPVLRERGLGLRHRRKKKTTERKSDKHRKQKKDLDTVDNIEDGVSHEVPLAFSCPVCLDVFYNAYTIQPCGHTFCEPCLRRLAKYSQDAHKTTTCPVCRHPIDSCVKDKELTSQVEFYMQEDFRRRKRTEGSNRFMRHPLPSAAPITLSPKRQLSRIVSRLERNRLARRRVRIGANPIRMDPWRFLSFFIAFLLLKGMLLTIMMCLYYLVYDNRLHVAVMDIAKTGALNISWSLTLTLPKFWGLGGVIFFGFVLVSLLKYGRTKGGLWPKPMTGLSVIQRQEY